MTNLIDPVPDVWTASDLLRRFGPIPLNRVRHDPPPGNATESDVIALHDREGRLYELVQGVLLQKTVGTYESFLAGVLVRILGVFVAEHDLGIILPPDGMMRLGPGLVRIPDVSFISWAKLPGLRIPDQAIADLVPDLAVEIVSRGNTNEEMEQKLDDYFRAGVRVVWYVYPAARQVHVYVARNQRTILSEADVLDGGPVLPGLDISLSSFFGQRKAT